MKKKDQKLENLEKMRHSTAHLLAAAVQELYPGVKFGIGPAIEDGFYYDFDFNKDADQRGLGEKDLEKIEKKMKEIKKKNLEFKKKIYKIKEAKEIFKDQPYKLELIEDLEKEGEKEVSVYQLGNFIDLCKGPHVKNTKEIGEFKLTTIAGAYWKGDEKNPMLTRIYGTVFPTKEELKKYLKNLEEAQKRDHRILGEKLKLFMISPEVGKGLPLWLPKGAAVRKKLEDYIYEKERKYGYKFVYTPEITKEKLFEISGHLAHYKEDMYSPIDIEGEKYYLKPMNCPFHHMIYKNEPKSYRDLPLRLAEFGRIYRYERSGVLTGLIRVRGFTQNDAHIYCTEEQMEEELLGVFNLFKEVYKEFNISDYWFRLSLPDFSDKEKFGDIKDKETWNKGIVALRSALKKARVDFVEAIGEAAFYGPKIDIQLKNVYGKDDTIVTIQVDFYMPSRFDLTYIDKDGKEKRPVVIHRAILGSFERFFAFLVEKTAGEFPLWLAPEQIRILPINDKLHKYAQKIKEELEKEDLLVEIDDSAESLGKKIRNSELEKIPYMIIVGEKEQKNKKVSIRSKKEGDLGSMKIEKFVERLKREIKEKK